MLVSVGAIGREELVLALPRFRRLGELLDRGFVLFDRAHEPRHGLLAGAQLRLELGRVSTRAATRALPRQRLAQLRDLALERVFLAAILLGRRLEPHRLALAAAQLRELALQVV